MSGHMGNRKVTVRKLEVMRVDPDNNIMLIKGAVPGSPNGLILIRKITSASKES
jgi:large subunit ribosomal protein L3